MVGSRDEGRGSNCGTSDLFAGTSGEDRMTIGICPNRPGRVQGHGDTGGCPGTPWRSKQDGTRQDRIQVGDISKSRQETGGKHCTPECLAVTQS